MRTKVRALAGALWVALSPLALAEPGGDPIETQVLKLDAAGKNRGQAQVAGKIASNFDAFAGSKENSLALVNALRNGTDAKLTYATAPTRPGGTPTTTTSTYDPPTGKMGWGNVKISLALAQDSLARAGITHPTAQQLQAALNGGSVTVKNPDGTTTTTKLGGVLQQRADGMGWGQIAKANGTKVGPVVSQLKMANIKVATIPPSPQPAPPITAAGVATSKAQGITTASTTTHGRGVVTGAGGSATHASGVSTANGGGHGKGNPGGNGNGKGNGGGKGG